MRIGQDRREAIDWVQESMGYVLRPLAEMTYHGLVRRGLIVEGERAVSARDDLDAETMRAIGRRDYAARDNDRTEMLRRRARSSGRQRNAPQRIARITTPSDVDNAPLPPPRPPGS